MNKSLTTREIVGALDKYIIGQDKAKRNVAIALRNRWRRMNSPDDVRDDIVPNNILMIGPTGVGKTEIARRLAKIADAPFIKVEASKFTEVGYVGRDVESMIRDLVLQAVNMVKVAKKEEVKEKATQIVEDIILDAVLSRKTRGDSINVANDNNPEYSNENIRDRCRAQIRNDELNDSIIDIKVSKQENFIGMLGGGMMNESTIIGLNDMMSSIMPTKSKTRKVTIAEAKKILFEEEASKLIDMEEVKDQALEKAANEGIVFIDEIDKIISNNNKGAGPDVSREGVQRDLLPIIEGCAVNTKYGIIHTDHILFIAAGAFHLSKPSDLIPELQGRLPIRVELDRLVIGDFIRILKEPKNALIKQYQALFKAEGVTLDFDIDALDEIAIAAFKMNEEIENIGARRLHTVMSHLLNEFLFDVPDKIIPGSVININKAIVISRLAELNSKRNLNEYIL